MIDQLVIMVSGDRWSAMKIDKWSFSIMEEADNVLSEIIDIIIIFNICMFCW